MLDTVAPPALALVLVGASVVAALRILRGGRAPLWIVPAALGAILSAASMFATPPASATPSGAPLEDFGGAANFSTRWNAYRDLYGEPVGACEVYQGLLTCWTRYARIESHPDNPEPYRMMHGNLGIELAAARGVARTAQPRVPPVVLAYLAALRARGIDLLYWIGQPVTDPLPDGSDLVQYWDKTVLRWPAGSSDAAEVTRDPVGVAAWQLAHRGPDPARPTPWSPLRISLLVAAGTCVLISLIVAARNARTAVPL